ncbi:hypothetical protein D9757_003658 [Collybiopsis confluens]|uniref:Glucanase n=1 Tax=Collybiopsis confluens TaxID=2823264 RepID=A0A8H5HV12_9AGAR|nr:hypothetical protein D9757_003658 [Collybiopsis confluens]
MGQQIGTLTAETHPPLTWQECTTSGCTTQSSSVVLDANWRYLHQTTSGTNCYEGNEWDTTLCPDPTTCANNCALDGASYEETYGVVSEGDSLTLKFVTTSEQKNVGSRLYLMAPGSETEYQIFKLVNQEFTFDVDVSQLPCGLNGALYFSQMDADGGLILKDGNSLDSPPTRLELGTELDTVTLNAHTTSSLSMDWTPSTNNPNTGTGNTGSCCAEMDLWEANSQAAAYTAHPCTVTEQTACTGTTCSSPNSTAGVCDQAGCDFNSFRLGDTSFYGPGLTVDTTQPFTVVTQFVSSNNQSSGTLSSIRRLYVQNGKVIQNSETNIPGITATNEIDTNFCAQKVTALGDPTTFSTKGGLAGMGTAMNDGMVLVLSLWDDYAVNMLWLDSDFPTNGKAAGDARGPCPTNSGVPATVEAQSPNAQVVYSNIKFGAIGSTFAA